MSNSEATPRGKTFPRSAGRIAWVTAVACFAAAGAAAQGPGTIEQKRFGTTNDGTPVELYTLTNTRGMRATISTYGATLVSLLVPDRKGQLADVVLGFDSLAGYLGKHPFFGGIVGRYANRIAGGHFTLDGKTYTLATNDGPNHLHGGLRGFDRVVWKARDTRGDGGVGVVLTHRSPDGDEGYPGNLDVRVRYLLTEEGALRIDYVAHTDAPTVVNLTNHSYFNLAGAGSGDILGHELEIDAERFTPIDDGLIPTGDLASVAGTPLDFRKATAIGARIEVENEQLHRAKGYDHNFIRESPGASLSEVARVRDPASGRVLVLMTTEPALQFYSGNFLDGITGKGGKTYSKRSGLCLEPQHYPNSPNEPRFPSTVLRPGESYRQTSVYRFEVE